MRSIFDKFNDSEDLGGLIHLYGDKKCMEWLESRPYGETLSDYKWILYCIEWEIALYGGIRYDSERIERKIIAISR